jgi:glycosyltransferase involved in cell wall biosynthesis
VIDRARFSQQETHGIKDRITTKDRVRGLDHIALFMPSFEGGGVERVMLTLAEAFSEQGARVDLVVYKTEGPFRDQVPGAIHVVALRAASAVRARLCALAADPGGLRTLLRPVLLPLQTPKSLHYLPDLVGYLRRARPQVLLSATTKPNLMAIWARHLAGVPSRVVISEHNTLSVDSRFFLKKKRNWHRRFLPPLLARVYPQADAIIAVSHGVAADLSLTTGIARKCITMINNPVVTPALLRKAQLPLDHPWFATGSSPVVLGVGRLHEQKDFPTLIKAFARVRAKQEARLLILGEAKEVEYRTELTTLAAQLGVADDVMFPGFVDNPFAYMARAAVFVLSSAWEGFGNVVAEALACGCPVVSTDCPSGPAEILEHGKYGPLVPVGDDAALAEAILAVLKTPPDRGWLCARGARFAVDHIVERYLEVLRSNEGLR